MSKRPALRMFLNTGRTKAIPLLKSEAWGNVDFGLIEADFEPSTHISWLGTRVTAPTDVWKGGRWRVEEGGTHEAAVHGPRGGVPRR